MNRLSVVQNETDKWSFLWLCLLFLSFSYELPLVELTSMERMNPRFFDLVSILGILILLRRLPQQKALPILFYRWVWIIAGFGFCTFAWGVWLPWEHYKYSLFYLFRYLQGLLTIYLALKITLSSNQKKILHYLVIAGGFIVAIYAIPEYLRGGGGRMAVESADKELVFQDGVLLSCLGPNYFHVAQFSAMASIMTIALSFNATTPSAKFFYILLSMFLSWPAMFCGCRAGIALVLLSWLFFFMRAGGSHKITIIFLLLFFLLSLFAFTPQLLTLDYWMERSLGVQRLIEIEDRSEQANSVMSRMLADQYNLDLYRWQGIRVPFIGAGFYAAALTLPDGSKYWRHSHGIHNCYLFAIEQGGLVVFVLFIMFLLTCQKELIKVRKTATNQTDRAFAMGMHSFFYALLIVMMGGQIFWQGFGTVNFNTYLILLFCMATVHTDLKY